MTQEVQNARNTISTLIPLIEEAERKIKSARNWGFIDIFGGGFLTDVIKHMNLNAAASVMQDISYQLGTLQNQLKTLTIPTDYRMQMGGFSTFADFIFDGAIFDIYMQSKIMKSLDEVRNLKSRLVQLDNVLSRM